jgi:hypothetical protein
MTLYGSISAGIRFYPRLREEKDKLNSRCPSFQTEQGSRDDTPQSHEAIRACDLCTNPLPSLAFLTATCELIGSVTIRTNAGAGVTHEGLSKHTHIHTPSKSG